MKSSFPHKLFTRDGQEFIDPKGIKRRYPDDFALVHKKDRLFM